MRRIPLASLIVLAGIVRAAEVEPSAPTIAPPRSGSTETITTTARTLAAPTRAKRMMSTDTAAKLSAAVPKFTPGVAEPVAMQAPESPVMQVPDNKPRNQIVRLPQFIVGEPKVHIPQPLQVLTPKGRVELAFQRHPGLRLVPLARMNAGVALEMFEDDLQAQRRAEAAELMGLYRIH